MTEETLKSISQFILVELPGQLPIMIELGTHKVVNWPKGAKEVEIEGKVRDEGVYTLLDAAMTPLYRVEGYVPNKFLPPEDGYDDYIDLCISSDGIVENMYENPDFASFMKEGYYVSPVTNSDNILFVISNILKPWGEAVKQELDRVKAEEFETRRLYMTLSKKPDVSDALCELESRVTDEIIAMIPKVKSLWIDYLVCHPKWGSRAHQGYVFTDIELGENSYYITCLGKEFQYGTLPTEEDKRAFIQKMLWNFTDIMNAPLPDRRRIK